MSSSYYATAGKKTYRDIIDLIGQRFSSNGNNFGLDGAFGKQTLSIESLNDLDSNNRGAYLEQQRVAAGSVRELLSGLMVSTEDNTKPGKLSIHQEAVGLVLMQAFQDPKKLVKLATEGYADSHSELVKDNLSTEAFNEATLTGLVGSTFVFNVQALRQGPAAELLFKTVVLTPDNPAQEIVVNRPVIINDVRHRLTGKPIDFNRRNIYDAYIEPNLLNSGVNKLIPAAVTAGANTNASLFAATGDVPYWNEISDLGNSVQTGALKPGVEQNLLGLGLWGNELLPAPGDRSDCIDPGSRVSKVWVKFATGTATGVIPFNLNMLGKNQWMPAAEGNNRDLTLQFDNEQVMLTAATKGIDGNVSALAAALPANTVVEFRLSVGGRGNVEKGTFLVNTATLILKAIRTKSVAGDGTVTWTDTTEASRAAVEAIVGVGTLCGWYPDATISDSNLSQRGLMLDTVGEKQRFVTKFGFPLVIPSPLIEPERINANMQTLINTQRIRNDLNAFGELVQFDKDLQELVAGIDRTDRSLPTPEIQCVARWLVRPYHKAIPLDVSNSTNSVRSYEKLVDLRANLISNIRQQAIQAIRESGIQLAIDSMETSGDVAKIGVVTDPVIRQYLLETADPRTFGDIPGAIESTYDRRIRNKIYVVIGLGREGEAHPLNWGQFYWTPEMMVGLQVARNQRNIREVMVQPRTLHAINVPIVIRFDVTGIEQYIAEYNKYQMLTEEV